MFNLCSVVDLQIVRRKPRGGLFLLLLVQSWCWWNYRNWRSLRRVQHRLQDRVIKTQSVQRPAGSGGGDLLPSALLPDAQMPCPCPCSSSVPAPQKPNSAPQAHGFCLTTKTREGAVNPSSSKSSPRERRLRLLVQNVLPLVWSSETAFTIFNWGEKNAVSQEK